VAGLSIKKVLKVVSEVRDRSGGAPRLCLVGDGPELRAVALAVSQGAADAVDGVSGAFDVLGTADVPADGKLLRRWAAVVLVGAACDAAAAARVAVATRAASVPLVALVPDRDLPSGAAWLASARIGRDETAVSLGREGEPKPTLQGRLAAVLGDDGIALAQRLPWCRRAVAERLVLAGARQNGVIGAVIIIPGADMPAMTLNQIRMVLRIATAYGEELGLDRALEILSVVGTGLVFRTLARQALDFVPGFGWAVKGAVGFSGTVALGSAAIEYFEAGAPLTPARFKKLAGTVDRLRRVLPSRGVAAG
jgi:uncharacterized protein (DUF697 family)